MLLRATPKAGPSNGKISISEVEDSVFCEVCTLKMWTPYILECGHAYCGSCLEDWFNTILNQHKAVHPHYNINQQQYAHAEAFAFGHPHYMHLLGGGISHPKYTCPTCREQVRNPPIEDFNLKKVVRAVARAQGETSPRKEGADSNRRKGKAKLKAPVMRPDPWSKFFRKRD
ncbi:hypothetical protein GYMLUDRAFT_67583 [Collybiopsis luxurians FD-317 M1]|nr:hypothetical protein GYMLUDRAFT_67583 [Collybiopsis luxurians FD-317 M1]